MANQIGMLGMGIILWIIVGIIVLGMIYKKKIKC